MYLPSIRKALAAGIVGLVTAVGVALADGNLTLVEALAALGAGLTTGAATYKAPANEIPNPPADDVEASDLDLLPDLPHAG